MLCAPLAKANGEIEPGDRDQLLSAYVKHMRPGGGMCAEAACFMTMALHASIQAPIHGLPEVTIIATAGSGNPQAELRFHGLWTEELETYFNSPRCDSVGACWQAAKIPYAEQNPDVLWDADSSAVRELEHGLRSYILSGMPVIFPVDVGRMQGLGSGREIKYVQRQVDDQSRTLRLSDPLNAADSRLIFGRNGLTRNLGAGDCRRDRAHVVVIVGCTVHGPRSDAWEAELTGSSRSQPVPTTFAFHDPAHQPFMQASAHELLLGACYEKSSDASGSSAVLSLGWFLPVTPRSVKMPLLDETTGTYAGIKDVSAALREKDISLGGIRLKIIGYARRRSEFRLIRMHRQALKAQLQGVLGETGGEESLDALATLCSRLIPRHSDLWCWAEIGAGAILLWDARKVVSKVELAVLENDYAAASASQDQDRLRAAQERARALTKKLLLAAAVWREGKRQILPFSGEGAPPVRTHSRPRLRGTLRPVLLDSFDTSPRPNCLRIGTGLEPVESYVLMQRAADRLLLRRRERLRLTCDGLRWRLHRSRHADPEPQARPSALELMSRACDDQALINRTAASLLRSGRDLAALATYLPSLCMGPRAKDGTAQNPALAATRFVLRVAGAVKRLSGSRHPSIVELVGGSLVLPVELDCAAGRPFARCVDPDIATQNLVVCLGQLLPDIEVADVALAFEYEPSALCALGSLERVTRLCEQLTVLSEHDRRWDQIGINLDIAHWAFVGRYKPSDLPLAVRRRIFHAHVSSHSRGHLGDAPLEGESGADLLRTPDEFMAWFVLMEDLQGSGDFRGNVSLELECCKSRKAVHVSLCNLSEWLRAS